MKKPNLKLKRLTWTWGFVFQSHQVWSNFFQGHTPDLKAISGLSHQWLEPNCITDCIWTHSAEKMHLFPWIKHGRVMKFQSKRYNEESSNFQPIRNFLLTQTKVSCYKHVRRQRWKTGKTKQQQNPRQNPSQYRE